MQALEALFFLRKKTIFIVLIFFHFYLTYAQQYSFRNYSMQHGLAQSQVTAICQDKFSYLWLGTNGGGLCKFDGINFETFTIKNGLNSNKISCLYIDKKDNLWIGSNEGGLCKFNGVAFEKIILSNKATSVISITEDINGDIWLGTELDGIIRVHNNKIDLKISYQDLRKNSIQSIQFDKQQNLIIATKESGLLEYSNSSLSSFLTIKSSLKGNISNQCIGINQIEYQNWCSTKTINTIFIDSEDNYWFGTNSGLYCFDNNFHQFKKHFFYGDNITKIIEDNNNCLWVSTFGNGIYAIENNQVKHYAEKEGLQGTYVNTIFIDNSNNLWIGSDGNGLFRYEGSRFKYFNSTNGLSENVVMSIFEDSKKRLWFGSFGKGITCFDNDKIYYYSKKNGLPDDVIYDIVEDSLNQLWFATRNGGLSCYNGKTFNNFGAKDGLTSNYLSSIAIDKLGNLWIASKENGLYIYTHKKFVHLTKTNGLFSNKIWVVYVDMQNSVWVGYDMGGINKISITNPNLLNNINSESFYIQNFNTNDSLKNAISSITQDNKGAMWFGSQGSGIYCLKDGKFVNYSSSQKLTSEHIYSLIFDNKENLWAGSEKGVDKITFNKDYNIINLKHFGYDEGFIGIETNLNAICKQQNGDILFGTVNGVMLYSPTQDKLNKQEPKLHLKEILLFFEKNKVGKYGLLKDNKDLIPKNLVLPYNMNHLTFKFIGIELSYPEKVLYKWKLEGFDDDWSPINNKNEAIYSNIPPGNYVFKVISYNNDGIPNSEPISYSFSVEAPFWQRWWFYTLSILFCLSIFFTYQKLRIRGLQFEKRQLEEMVDLRTEELQIVKENVQRSRDTIQEQIEELKSLNKILSTQKKQIEEKSQEVLIEKKKSDDLLLNILPKQTADELKFCGKASVQRFEMVSVLFSDIIGFTKISEQISRNQLIEMLDTCFVAFDEITEKYGIEKIKTIGDAYMCAGGIPFQNSAIHIKTVLAGLEFQEEMKKINLAKSSEINWQIRVGIHTGSVIAGVVGKRKFAYDIWGRAVNTASRIETSGEANKVNISEATYQLVKDYFICEHRGKIEAKNIQEIDMYFVIGLKPEYANLSSIQFPSNEFLIKLENL